MPHHRRRTSRPTPPTSDDDAAPACQSQPQIIDAAANSGAAPIADQSLMESDPAFINSSDPQRGEPPSPDHQSAAEEEARKSDPRSHEDVLSDSHEGREANRIEGDSSNSIIQRQAPPGSSEDQILEPPGQAAAGSRDPPQSAQEVPPSKENSRQRFLRLQAELAAAYAEIDAESEGECLMSPSDTGARPISAREFPKNSTASTQALDPSSAQAKERNLLQQSEAERQEERVESTSTAMPNLRRKILPSHRPTRV
jgi:hypothetical protein